MTAQQKTCLLAVSIMFVCLLSSCETVSVHRFPRPGRRVGHVPPPHAPAYGHRRKHLDGLELVYDSTYGIYMIVGMPDHYYLDGHFYRLYGGIWEISLRVDAGWAPTTTFSLPPGLQKKAHGGRAMGQKKKVVASAAHHKSKGRKTF